MTVSKDAILLFLNTVIESSQKLLCRPRFHNWYGCKVKEYFSHVERAKETIFG